MLFTIQDFATECDTICLKQNASRLFVAQMQDYLGLGKGCRMNTPGTSSGNWQWRMLPGEASKKLAKTIHETSRIYGRL